MSTPTTPWVLKRVEDESTSSVRRIVLYYRGPSETLLTHLTAVQALNGAFKGARVVTDVSRLDDSNNPAGFCDLAVTYEPGDGSSVGESYTPDADGLIWLDFDMPWQEVDIGVLECDNAQALRTTADGGHPDWVANLQDYVDIFKARSQQYLEAGGDEPSWSPNTPKSAGGAIPNGFVPSAPMKDLANDLAMLLRDQPDLRIPVSVPTVRKVQVVTAISTLKGSVTNLNRVYTAAAFAAEEPGIALTPYIDSDILLDYYWRKKTPGLDRASGNVRQITQIWEGVKDFNEFCHGELITT